jgi:hypothetical protein
MIGYPTLVYFNKIEALMFCEFHHSKDLLHFRETNTYKSGTNFIVVEFIHK